MVAVRKVVLGEFRKKEAVAWCEGWRDQAGRGKLSLVSDMAVRGLGFLVRGGAAEPGP